LTSALNIWEVYYEYAFGQYLNKGQTIDTDWCKGYADDAVGISTLNTSAPPMAPKRRRCAVAASKPARSTSSTLRTSPSAAKSPAHMIDLSHYDYSARLGRNSSTRATPSKPSRRMATVSYFSESPIRSAPYFRLKIDGITWLN
jgi:basic membrane protein A